MLRSTLAAFAAVISLLAGPAAAQSPAAAAEKPAAAVGTVAAPSSFSGRAPALPPALPP